ncbi:hypothetical protein SKC41_30540 [Mycobacterium sp. 050128]|uniref:hypothetical protein n=1 Tax=Mycobacterium sp. 050128 TaxID=3096112 RepID=UPI002EDA13B5
MATHNVGIPEVLRPTATAQSKPGSVTLAAPASSATAIFASSKSDSAKSRRTAAPSRRPATGINPVPGPDDPPPPSAGIDGAAGTEPAGAPAEALCGGSTEPYGVMPPAGTPGAGAGAGADAGAWGVAATGAAAGAADVGAVSIGAANDVIGPCATGGTAPAAEAPAAKPRPKSIPSDDIGEPCNPDALSPAGGDIPPGKPPNPLMSPCSGPIESPPPDPPPGILGKFGKPPPNNDVNGL